MRERIDWIDCTKGLGMLLVIYGHCVKFGGFMHNLIFAFHMPMFFLLSGLFLNKNNSFKDFTIKKMKALLLPYLYCFCLSLILGAIYAVLQSKSVSVSNVFEDLYLGVPRNVSSVWFLMCMFFTLLLCRIIIAGPLFLQYFCVLILALFSCLFSVKFGSSQAVNEFRLPLCLDVVPMASLFMHIGYIKKDELFNFVDKLRYSTRQLLVFIGLLFAFVSIVLLNGRVNLHGLDFNNVFLYVIEGLLGSVLCICLCNYIQKNFLQLSKLLRYMGKNSIVILGAQAVLVRVYVVAVNKLCHTSYGLYGLPPVHVGIQFVFVFIGCLATIKFIDKLKKVVQVTR